MQARLEPSLLTIETVALDQHLTRASLDAALETVRLEPPMALIVDCSEMTGYDADARRRFVDWHAEHRNQLECVAVVTEKRLWQMIVSAMSLASGVRMRAFDTHDDAHTWLSKLGG